MIAILKNNTSCVYAYYIEQVGEFYLFRFTVSLNIVFGSAAFLGFPSFPAFLTSLFIIESLFSSSTTISVSNSLSSLQRSLTYVVYTLNFSSMSIANVLFFFVKEARVFFLEVPDTYLTSLYRFKESCFLSSNSSLLHLFLIHSFSSSLIFLLISVCILLFSVRKFEREKYCLYQFVQKFSFTFCSSTYLTKEKYDKLSLPIKHYKT